MTVSVIILAAGQGSRLAPLTNHCHKSLLPFGDEPLLVRTIRQLHSIGLLSIRIVVGHLQETIKKALLPFHPSIQFINNSLYATDTNSLSLHLGLEGIVNPVLIIEADVVLSEACLPIIKKVCEGHQSVWFTHDVFKSHQVGGIIRSNASKQIEDMRIVPHFDSSYAEYSKNLGVVYIGPDEINNYKKILLDGISSSITFYYMEYWIQHLSELIAFEVNLFPHPAGSFNTVEELEYCRQLVS
jgi:CTP:phosphocholine cytidylyltransferase-like protein